MKKQIVLFALVMFPMLAFSFTGDVIINDIKYYIDTDERTAEVRANNYFGNIVLPPKINYDGVECAVTSIGPNAFSGCSGLKTISVPQSVKIIKGDAFRDCTGLIAVHISDISAWCRISIANDYAANPLTYAHHLYIDGEEVKDLTIPDDITSIPLLSFYGCWSLSSLTISANITFIGGEAFGDCPNLVRIKVESGNITYDSRGNCNAIIDSETNTLVLGCQNTTIPDDVIAIGHCAFSGCTNLISLSIPDKVSSIKNWAFYGCTGLTNIVIPNSVETIGDYVFDSCSGLVSVTIPNSLTKIGKSVFVGCTALMNVTSEILEPYSINQNVFTYSTYNHGTLYVPSGTKDLYVRTSGWTNFLKIQEIGNEEAQKYLSLYDGSNGTMKLAVKEGNNYTFIFEPENGWRINTLTYNGLDVTTQIDSDGHYTTPSITSNSTLNIVYEQGSNAIHQIQNNEKYKVYSNEEIIVVKGTQGNETINVYSENGILQTTKQAENGETTIGLKGNQIYILKIGNLTAKVFVK